MGDCKEVIFNQHSEWEYRRSGTDKNLSQSPLNSKSRLHWPELNHPKEKGWVDSDL